MLNDKSDGTKSICGSFSIGIVSSNGVSQTIITRSGKVIYFDNRDTVNSKKLQNIAKLCNCFIQKFYSDSMPYILLDIETADDTLYYQLGYDNIHGNSIDNDIYPRKTWDYTMLGMRIKPATNI